MPELLNKCITGQAVPFFFIVSGFFFSKNYIIENDKRIKDCVKYSLKLFTIYFIWQIIYLWPTLKVYMEKYEGESWYTYLFILVRRFFIAGNGAWWYLLVLGESVIVLKIATKAKRCIWALYVVSVIGLLLGLQYDSFNLEKFEAINKLNYVIFSWSNNIFMKGLPYVTAGYLIAKNEDIIVSRIGSRGVIVSGLTYVISIIASVILFALTKTYTVLVPIQAIAIFIFSILCDIKVEYNVCKKCRNLSSVIYLTHWISVFEIYYGVIGKNVYGCFGFTIFTCVLIYCLVKKFNNKWLNYVMMVRF